ncbi:Nucleic-acid-binding protein from transposon X-element [Eumeta japonica]|uniref:Nucleic-acid-binding protein from transposon X-element n=1 Tax=Eumeta variegata TaxID=151549 RepID=A0A4C1TZQ6_EUMVA|nr:Nucleic-acid-binding protein from transposon X-element [Eumeta japonica]
MTPTPLLDARPLVPSLAPAKCPPSRAYKPTLNRHSVNQRGDAVLRSAVQCSVLRHHPGGRAEHGARARDASGTHRLRPCRLEVTVLRDITHIQFYLSSRYWTARTTVHYSSYESESDFGSDDSKGEEEPFTKVQSRKARARQARLIASGAITFGPGFQCYSPAKAKTNSGSTPSSAASAAPTPTPSWGNTGAKKKLEQTIQTDIKSKKPKKPEIIVEDDGDCSTPAPHFQNQTNLLATMKAAYHTYSLEEEREFRLVLKGVPKEFLLDEVKNDLVQKLLVRAVRHVTNRNRDPLDLVLVSADPSTKDNVKAILFKIKTVCSLSGIKVELPHKRSSPRQCHNCQLYGHSSKNCFRKASCVKCLGDHGTAPSTRNKETDGPPAYVLCNTSGHTVNCLGCPCASKKYPLPNRNKSHSPNDKAAPCRAPARAVSKNITYANVTAGRLNPIVTCLRTH